MNTERVMRPAAAVSWTEWAQRAWCPLVLMTTFLAASLVTFGIWRTAATNDVTGDEPHYLVVADSMWRYGTVELGPAYRDEFRDRAIYAPGLAAPDADPGVETLGTQVHGGHHGVFSTHNLGLPVLLAWPFAVGGVVFAKAAMIALSTLGVLITWGVVGRFTGVRRTRAWITAAIAVSAPAVPAAGQIYPDLLAGTILTGSLLCLAWLPRRHPAVIAATMIGLAWLPWLQIKFTLSAAIVVVAMAIRLVRNGGRATAAALAGLFAAALITLACYNAYAFGSAFGPYEGDAMEVSRQSLTVLAGLHIDQNQGVFMQAPVHLAGLAGLGLWFRRDHRMALTWLSVYASVVVPNAMHPNWFGGWSFSGRFNWTGSVLLAFPTALALADLSRRRARAFWIATAMAVVFQAYLFVQYAVRHVPLYNRTLLDAEPGEYSVFFGPLEHLLPRVDHPARVVDHPANLVWTLLIAAIVLTGILPRRRARGGMASGHDGREAVSRVSPGCAAS